jgi:RNA polymerase sigma factor (sigma-70 family)
MENITRSKLYEEAIQQLRKDFGWRFLEDSEYVSRIRDEVKSERDVTLEEAKAVAQGIYAEALYAACQQPEQCEQAYTELHCYLYTIAFYKQRDIAEDASQKAIELVYEKIGQCREPRAFLKFSQYKLLDAIKRIRRIQRVNREISVDPLEQIQSLERLAIASDGNPERTTIQRELVEKVRECIQQVLQRFTRAHRQLHAVLLKYFGVLSDSEIAERLDTTEGSVRVLRTRGLAKLRDCLEREEIKFLA